MKQKNVYFIRGLTFWNAYDMFYLVYLIGDVSNILNTFYYDFRGRYEYWHTWKKTVFSMQIYN